MEAAEALLPQTDGLVGEAPPSPAGPLEPQEAAGFPTPPLIPLPRLVQVLRFNQRQIEFVFRARRELGEVFRMRGIVAGSPVITSHPDHVRSLFTAKPELAPSLTGESPLRPIVGPNSVLTAVGPRHMRQRKLLLPAFHGEAIERYVQMISDVAEREIDRWPVGKPFPLAPRMQAVTLDVIMAGVFGIGARPARGTEEYRMRQTIRRLLLASTWPAYQLIELHNAGRMEPRGMLRVLLSYLDRHIHAVIRKRRAEGSGSHDVLSMLLEARDEDGQLLTDDELRDELLTLVLAGHETTANSLAWTFERLLRNPGAYDELRQRVRSGEDDSFVEATVYEAMRVRPVIPLIVRMVNRRWQLGDYVLPAQTPVAVSIVALHRRPDVYPDPRTFRPERFHSVAASAAASALRWPWPNNGSCCGRSRPEPT